MANKDQLSPEMARLADEVESHGIDADEVRWLREEVFADGVVSRDEAVLLFELNTKTSGADNAPGWQTLFVQAVGHHLMFPDGAPDVPDREEAARRQAWLEERRGVGHFMKDFAKGLNRFISRGQVTPGWLKRHQRLAAIKKQGKEAPQEDVYARSSIDPDEAAWLIAQIREDGELDDNERALLAHIKATATDIDAALEPLLAEAGV